MKIRYRILVGLLIIIIAGYLIPSSTIIPVQGASEEDWNSKTFWYHPWGKSGVHKGIDIFAKKGQPVLAASGGIVLFSGNIQRGGNIILTLGAKWRIHYYAHLNTSNVSTGHIIGQGDPIGTVGDTGNAKNTPPHLHYSVLSLLPQPWRIRLDLPQGWKRMFYLNPIELFSK